MCETITARLRHIDTEGRNSAYLPPAAPELPNFTHATTGGQWLAVVNSIIYGNNVYAAGSTEPDSAVGDQIGFLEIAQCDPPYVAYSNVQVPGQNTWSYFGTGALNINEDPLFEDESAGDFRLTANSLCIDAGVWSGIPKDKFNIARTGLTYLPVPDLDLEPRVAGCFVDMGAYEYLNPPSVAIPADLNRDCCVDFSDILILLNHWGPCADLSNCPSDLNSSGTVDFSDLILLLSAYGDGANCPSELLPITTIDDCFERIGLSNIEALSACIEALMSEE